MDRRGLRPCRCRSASGGWRPSVSRSRIMGVLAGTSTRTPTSSSGTTSQIVPRGAPAHGRRSGPRRVRARTAGAPRRASARCAACAPRASSSSSCRVACGPGLRVALAQRRQDQLLVQADLALDRRAPRPQVAGVDAGAQEPAGGGGDLDRVLAVQVGARACAWAMTPYSSSAASCSRVTDAIAHSSSRLTSTPGSSRGDEARRAVRRLARRRRRRCGASLAVRRAGARRRGPAGVPGDGRPGGRRSRRATARRRRRRRPSAPTSAVGAVDAARWGRRCGRSRPESMRSLITRSGRKFWRCSRRMTRSSSTSCSRNLR